MPRLQGCDLNIFKSAELWIGPREHDAPLNESDEQRKEANDLIHNMDSEKESNI